MSGDGVHVSADHMEQGELDKSLHRHQCCCYVALGLLRTPVMAVRGYADRDAGIGIGHQYAKSILQRGVEFVYMAN